ncbi:MAG TPA: cation:proton antiporter [Steroidobacteraceae bacterium]|nr:cation:proton antiporter [Steroidobacteraceae bacterium]
MRRSQISKPRNEWLKRISLQRSHIRWPLSGAVVCLALGIVGGVWGARQMPRLTEHVHLLQSLSEAALTVSLFCVGLRLPAAVDWRTWRVPLRLASVTLLATAALIAGVGSVFLGLTFTQGLLLGAILAPTDPVLGSHARLPANPDQDAVHFTLCAEGALGSALSLSLVLLALGLMGHHELGPLALRWLALDLVWAVASGLVLGCLVGAAASYARVRVGYAGQPGILELLLLLSVIALAYGGAFVIHGNGFLAVLSAGSMLARGGRLRPALVRARALPRDLASIAGQIERGTELVIVALVGALLAISQMHVALFLFALLVLIAVRPIAVRIGVSGLATSDFTRRMVGWFGVRGIASVYYLAYAVEQGLGGSFASELTAITLAVLSTSIALHALTALPLQRPVDQKG